MTGNNYGIKEFTRPEFGKLTTITNEKTGVSMFIGKEVADIWGHSNITKAIKDAQLNSDEYRIILFAKFPKFKKQLTNQKLVSGRAKSITFLTESGIYKLALASNLEKAKPFRDWITQEVLPSIRRTGQYIFVNQYHKLAIHKDPNIQRFNSKAINAKNFEKGLDAVIDYNRESCILHTGKTPSQLKKIGRQMGLKTKETSSGKEVLRHIEPEKAAAMSFTDSLVKEGYPLKTCAELSLKGLPLFKGMIELGIKP